MGPDGATAADLVRRGLAVFALPAGGRVPAPGWQQRIIIDPDQAQRLWLPGDNIGVSCRASQLVGIDLDHADHLDGLLAFEALCAAHGHRPPATLRVRTPHGRHLYLRAPAGVVITSSSGERSPLGPGIDIRAPGRRTGGYLIGPGSVVAGLRYRIEHDADIAPLPDWLIDHLRETT